MTTTPWDLDAVRERVGSEVVYTAPEPLGAASIRYFALAIGDDNPLYTDRDAARAAGYDDVVAPPTLLAETNQYVTGLDRDDDGYRGHTWDLEIPGTRLIRGGNRYVFGAPAHPDTVVTATWRITDVVEKERRDGSVMLIVTSEATYTNQDGEHLLTDTETLIYQPLPGGAA